MKNHLFSPIRSLLLVLSYMLMSMTLAQSSTPTSKSASASIKKGNIEVVHPHAVATVAGQTVGGVFFKHIANKGNAPDRLIAASVSKAVAERTELHTMNTENDVMRMRQIKAIELPAKSTVPMTRGLMKDGYHVMLLGLKAPLKVGDKLPLKLTFEKAGVVEVIVNIETLKASSATMPAHGAASEHQGHKH
jgi:periplasmic copper chaperone A